MTIPGQPAQGFVGRERELGQVRTALDRALAGRGQLVLLAGDAGIGKTRTTREVAAYAEALGARVLWGSCYEREGAPPYWPWIQALRPYVLQTPEEHLASEMGSGAADIAQIIPEVRGRIGGLGAPDQLAPERVGPEQARFRLLDSVGTFTKNASNRQPLMVVLDDLHWADRPSLLMLEFLAREIAEAKVLIVGAYRDFEILPQHPLADTLAYLTRQSNFQRVNLAGLPLSNVDQFIRAANAELAPSPDLIQAVHAQTEGNPFFMTEVVRLLGDRSAAESKAGATTAIRMEMSQGVLDVVGQRLNRLSAECVEALTSASVVGREFEFTLLRIICGGVSETRLLELIEEALGARIIEELPDHPDRYQFGHALMQQALRARLSFSRAVRIHARIGEALEEMYSGSLAQNASQLAHHFYEALPVTGLAKLAQYAALAGESALRQYAHEEAAANYQRALEAMGVDLADSTAAPNEAVANLLFGLARAQLATLSRLQYHDMYRSLSRAFEYYSEAGDVEKIVAIAEMDLRALLERRFNRRAVFNRALELVVAGSHEAGRVLSAYGNFQGMQDANYPGARESFDQALAIARRECDLGLEMRTRNFAAQVELWHLHPRRCSDEARQAIDLAVAEGDPRAEVGGRYWVSLASRTISDRNALKAEADLIAAPAERLGDRYWLATAMSAIAAFQGFEGRWDEEKQSIDRGLYYQPMDPRLLLHGAVLEAERGNQESAALYLRRMHEVVDSARVGPTTAYACLALAESMVVHMLPEAGSPQRADVAIDGLLSSPSVTPFFGAWANCSAGLVSVAQGDQPRAARSYEGLRPALGTFLVFVNCDRAMGLLAHCLGNGEVAAGHFEDALAICRRSGCRPELAWTCHGYAESLLATGRREDAEKAASLLSEAEAIASELGMRPLAARVASLKAKAEASPARSPAYSAGLTAREVEVLRLVMAGKTDREIGEDLVISVRTAGNHVSSILNKTGAANRTEAASFGALHGPNLPG